MSILMGNLKIPEPDREKLQIRVLESDKSSECGSFRGAGESEGEKFASGKLD